MKLLFFIIILITILFSCETENTKLNSENTTVKHRSIIIDDNIVQFEWDSINFFMLEGKEHLELTNIDKIEIDSLFKKKLASYNAQQRIEYMNFQNKNPERNLDSTYFIIDIEEYQQQYVATVNNKNEKIVWINCFCAVKNDDWKKGILFVSDGGNCFFNFKINLTKGIVFDFNVNGII